MKENNRIAIIYHSGAGSTKTIATLYSQMLIRYAYSVDIHHIRQDYDYRSLAQYSYIIFAFPTYHCSPSKTMLEFLINMPPFSDPKRAFVFTTCGLFSGNTLREFVKIGRMKNLLINGYATYRAPASDGSLLLPPISFMYRFEKNLDIKIKRDICKIDHFIKTESNINKCPPFRLIEILNYPNKIGGKAMRHKLTVSKADCIKCKKCIEQCIRGGWTSDGAYPVFQQNKCEYCFKCIHHCPKEAILLNDRTKKKQKLNDNFYNKAFQQISENLLTEKERT